MARRIDRILVFPLLCLGLTACIPLPVEDDKHPDMPLLSETVSSDKVEIARLVDSPHVEAVLDLGSGRFLVHLIERNPHVDFNDPKHRAVSSERLLVFEGVRQVARIDARSEDLAEYDATTSVRSVMADEHGGFVWHGRYYRDHAGAGRPMEVLGIDALTKIIAKRAALPERQPGDEASDAAPELSPAMRDAIETQLKSLASDVTAYDAYEGVCVLPGEGWLIPDCRSPLAFGDTTGQEQSLVEFVPEHARRPSGWRGVELCDEGAARCWDKAVAANHCSGNHFVAGCTQSYMYYADLPLGDAILRFKSVPGKEAPFAVHRISDEQVVMASQKGVFVVRRKR